MRYIVYSDRILPILDILQMGYSKDPETTHFGPAVHGYYIVHYVISGKGVINSHEVRAGQGFLIRPGKTDYYYADKDEPWEFLWIIADDIAMNVMMSYYNADKKTEIFDYDNVETVREAAQILIENKDSTFRSSQMLEMYLKIFNGHTDKNAAGDVSGADMYVRLAKNYIESNIYNRVSVNDILDYLGVSQPYLFKIFKKSVGMSPKKYIDKYKLKKAKEMLTGTNLSISDIAEGMGYYDVHGFSKFFKENEGISPLRYRTKAML